MYMEENENIPSTNWNYIADLQRGSNEDMWQLGATNAEYNGVISRWLNPGEAQKQTWSQQMVSQMYQNEWNSEVNKMARAKEAGINLNTAAAAIAGGNSSSVPAPSPQSVGSPLSDISNLANAATGGVANVAGAQKDIIQGVETRQLLPYKAISLLADAKLSLENIGLTRAQAEAVSIANHYKPVEFQLGIAKMRLELPMLIQQEKVLRSEYERNIAQADLIDQEIEESKANISLMSYQEKSEQARAIRDTAEAALITKRFEMLRQMNWDPATGLEGLVGSRMVDPDYSVDDLESLVDNLSAYSYKMSKYKFLADHNLGLDEGKSLFDLQSEADIATSHGVRKDIPVEIGVGPFKTSTSLRDLVHERNHSKHSNPNLYRGLYTERKRVEPHFHK